jgi:threonine dehydrogenase-like Zn-dependent dehydrogenase
MPSWASARRCISLELDQLGLAAAASARILGAAVVLIGDVNKERLSHAKKVGFEPIDLTKHDRLDELVADVLGKPEVACGIDCAGFEGQEWRPGSQIAKRRQPS